MPELEIRWSEHEARKPYARPFAVSFLAADTPVGSIAVSGRELLYYRHFQAATLTLLGELFVDHEVEASDEPQRLWLDRVGLLLPPAPEFVLLPESTFDDDHGRRFQLVATGDGRQWVRFDSEIALDYQEFQAAVAHQTGRLFRSPDVEEIESTALRERRWMEEISAMIERPVADQRLVPEWSWR